jgi:hypothetical protein
MERRTFMRWLGLGWLASVLPGCLPSTRASTTFSAPVTTSPVQAQAQTAVYVPIGSLREIEQAGVLVNEHNPVGPVMVVRDSANTNKLIAVTLPALIRVAPSTGILTSKPFNVPVTMPGLPVMAVCCKAQPELL